MPSLRSKPERERSLRQRLSWPPGESFGRSCGSARPRAGGPPSPAPGRGKVPGRSAGCRLPAARLQHGSVKWGKRDPFLNKMKEKQIRTLGAWLWAPTFRTSHRTGETSCPVGRHRRGEPCRARAVPHPYVPPTPEPAARPAGDPAETGSRARNRRQPAQPPIFHRIRTPRETERVFGLSSMRSECTARGHRPRGSAKIDLLLSLGLLSHPRFSFPSLLF